MLIDNMGILGGVLLTLGLMTSEFEREKNNSAELTGQSVLRADLYQELNIKIKL